MAESKFWKTMGLACTYCIEEFHLENLQKPASYKRKLIQNEDCFRQYLPVVLGRRGDYLLCVMELPLFGSSMAGM